LAAAIEMSGLPASELLQTHVLRIVLLQTHFGRLWLWRLVCGLAAVVTSLVVLSRPIGRSASVLLNWLALLASALLAGSLGWAGHGLSGGAFAWHLPADVLHLIIAGVWPMGLIPFLCILLAMRSLASHQLLPREMIFELAGRFSLTSVTSVVLLTASGLINSWALVGSFQALAVSAYGRVLLLKVIAFLVMAALGAVNLLYLRPRLRTGGGLDEAAAQQCAARWLQWTVIFEIALAVIVLLATAILGLLAPASETIMHHHH
jgi:copper resistance protein D